MDTETVTSIVTCFAYDLLHKRINDIEICVPGITQRDIELRLLVFKREYHPTDPKPAPPADWVKLGLYGQRLIDADPQTMQAIADDMARRVFSIPGSSTYHIPDEWADTPMGALWWSAVLRAEGDDLITLRDAAYISGLAPSTISGRISRGTLRAYINPNARNPTNGRTLVRRADAEALRR